MEASILAAWIGGIALVTATAITAGFNFRTAWNNARAQKEEKDKLNDTERLRIEMDAETQFRKELRDDIQALRNHVSAQDQKIAELLTRCAEVEGRELRLKQYFVGILYRMEGLVSLRDNALIITQIKALISSMKEVLDMPIGVPEAALKVLRQGDPDAEDLIG